MPKTKSVIPAEHIERSILVVRGQRVILDSELARLYGVSTARLNQQVRRNADRFPDDFAFALTGDEFENLMLQIATSRLRWGGRRKLPLVFTEHGAVMAASVLNSPIAVSASIEVVRAFVRLRQLIASQKDLARRLDELEARFTDHDRKLVVVFDAIRQLMEPPPEPSRKKRRIGFHPEINGD